MEQKRRGRPPSYDAGTALTQAQDVFWTAGFSATSLDDISSRTGMNRPSLYGAFGDKRALYLRTLRHYQDASRQRFREVLGGELPLREALLEVYRRALDIYFADDPARGCYMLGTATAEALENDDVRALLADSVRELDGAFTTLIERGIARGEVACSGRPADLARLASGIVYLLALRSRTGSARGELERAARTLVDTICGPSDAAVAPG